MRHNGPVRVLAAMASRVGRVVHTGMRQYYGTVSQPPPGVEHTYTPDIIIFDCPSPGKVMVGDVTIPHPLRPSEAIRVRQHQGRVLKMAERAAKDKERKVRSFLDALYAEKAILPPADSQFVHRGGTPGIYVQWVAPQARFFSGFCRTSTFFFFF